MLCVMANAYRYTGQTRKDGRMKRPVDQKCGVKSRVSDAPYQVAIACPTACRRWIECPNIGQKWAALQQLRNGRSSQESDLRLRQPLMQSAKKRRCYNRIAKIAELGDNQYSPGVGNSHHIIIPLITHDISHDAVPIMWAGMPACSIMDLPANPSSS